MKQVNLVVVLFLVYAFAAATLFQECDNLMIEDQPFLTSAVVNNTKDSKTVVFNLYGNVYPAGYFYAQITIGSQSKDFFLHIDSGSDLAWLQCEPCNPCVHAPHPPYKYRGGQVQCSDPLCSGVHHPKDHDCHHSSDPCYYRIAYYDKTSSIGPLVKDKLIGRLKSGTKVTPMITFGCGNQQRGQHSNEFDGSLGLLNTKVSIGSQLARMGVTRNVISHCFRSRGSGRLYFGDEHIPSSKALSVRMSVSKAYYTIGPANLLFDGTNIANINTLIIDSGTTYTSLNSQIYQVLRTRIEEYIGARLARVPPAESDASLMCWKGPRPFRNFQSVEPFFKNLALRFPQDKNVIMEIPLQSYIIISGKGYACLGIQDSRAEGYETLNVIGAITMLDKLVIYDNEKNQFGWTRKCPEPQAYN